MQRVGETADDQRLVDKLSITLWRPDLGSLFLVLWSWVQRSPLSHISRSLPSLLFRTLCPQAPALTCCALGGRTDHLYLGTSSVELQKTGCCLVLQFPWEPRPSPGWPPQTLPRPPLPGSVGLWAALDLGIPLSLPPGAFPAPPCGIATIWLWSCVPGCQGASMGNTKVFPGITPRQEDISHPLSPSCWQMLCSGSLLFRCPSNYAMKWLLSLYRISEPKTDVNRHTWVGREHRVFKPCCYRSRLRSLTSSVDKELLKLKTRLVWSWGSLECRLFGVGGPLAILPAIEDTHWMKRAEATHTSDYSGVLDERSPGPQKPGWKLSSRIPASCSKNPQGHPDSRLHKEQEITSWLRPTR